MRSDGRGGSSAGGRLPPPIRALDGEEFRRWVLAAVATAGVGYAAVLAANLVLNPQRTASLVSQALALAAIAGGWTLAWRGRADGGAALTVLAVWVELHSTIPFEGLQPSALAVFPALVVAAGLLAGGWGAVAMAGGSTLSLGVSALLAGPAADGLSGRPADGAYLLAVTAASMGVVAAFMWAGVSAYGRMTRAALEGRRALAELLRHAPDGIVALDGAGVVRAANQAAGRILGRTPGELVGRPLAATLADRGGEEGRSVVDAALSGRGGPPVVFELGRDGSEPVWVEVEGAAAPMPWGEPGYEIALRDVTRRRAGEEAERLRRVQLEHAHRLEAIGRLAGGVAHDFNNIFTTVGASAELLLADVGGEVRELAQEILAARDRGAALTHQLLAFARKEAIAPSPVDLGDALRRMEPILAHLVPDDVHLTTEAPERVAPVSADLAQVERVVLSLISNAVDVLAPGGTVRVGVTDGGGARRWKGGALSRVPEGRVELWVEDDGPGMEESVAERIFEPFFTTKGPGRGTGLGLASVHGIASQNGGEVGVVTGPSVGTVLRVFWPAAESD